ncbi:hypothetical protein MD484_g8741, partial [Candolleomyces efflorescens]
MHNIETKLDRLAGAVETLAAFLKSDQATEGSGAVPSRPVVKKRRIPRHKSTSENTLAVSSHYCMVDMHEAYSLQADVRKHLDRLLNDSPEPFVGQSTSQRFALRAHTSDRRSCSVYDFSIDLSGGSRSAWNKSAAEVFAEDFIEHYGLEADRAESVKAKFHTRVKSIKQTDVAHRKGEIGDRRKVRNTRKYMLYVRRLLTLEGHPALKSHVPFVQDLGWEGMSTDESDADEVGAHAAGYWVLTPLWRSTELTTFLHLIDSIALAIRRSDASKQRGSWPRVRNYDPQRQILSKNQKFVRQLPINAYDAGFLARLADQTNDLKPKPPYALTIPAAIFGFYTHQPSMTTPASPGRFSKYIHTNNVLSESELNEVKSLLEGHQAAIRHLDSLRQPHISATELLLAVSSPCKRIPADILLEIFLACIPSLPPQLPMSKQHPAVVVSHVCRLWRTIALKSSLLWSTIHLEVPPLPSPELNLRGGLEVSEATMIRLGHQIELSGYEKKLQVLQNMCLAWLDRAAKCPLNIVFKSRDPTVIEDQIDSYLALSGGHGSSLLSKFNGDMVHILLAVCP